MASQNRSTRFVCLTIPRDHLTSVTFPNAPPKDIAAQPAKSHELSFNTTSGSRPQDTSFPTHRCEERGCVFPAASAQSGKCVYHERQMEEPALFRSQQPSHLLLDPARGMPTDEEYDESRKRDRLRLAKEWEEFQGASGV
ncbi:MAG TPA: hypothetical protein VMW54_02935 [Terriglobia bacterium]|nr:hypothetical protein [Terriglobia bacterium]